MNLQTYYENLPAPIAPKIEFIREISRRTGKVEDTIRGWVKGRNFPSDESDILILEEVTGIPRSELLKPEEPTKNVAEN